MAYNRINWTNSSTTPLNEQNLNVMDKGIADNAQDIASIKSGAGIPDNAVTTPKIATGAVTGGLGGKIAQNTIKTYNIANGAVTTDKIEDEAVEAEQIADGAITLAKLATDLSAMLPKYTLNYKPVIDAFYPDNYTQTGIYGIWGSFNSILLIVFVVNYTIMQISIQNNVVKLRNKPSSAGAWTNWVVVGGA